jgi:hypothetical protein
MLPFFIVLKISFAEADVAIPPYTEIYTYADKIPGAEPGQLRAAPTTSCTSRPTWAR